MAERRGSASARHGHPLRPLPTGERWLSGEGTPRRIIAQPASPDDDFERELEDFWTFEEFRAAKSGAPVAPAPVRPESSRRPVVLLVAVSLAALVTIVVSHWTGDPANPSPLPAPPSHVITAVSLTRATPVSIRVGDYLDFQLPGGRTYSTVLEQPPTQVPVVEAITLPGQQPQLQGDSAGKAVVEVMAAPLCTNPDGCPDQRTLLGTVDLTVTP